MLLLTVDGVFSLSQVAVAAVAKRDATSVTDKIRNALRAAAVTYGDRAGWQIVQHGPLGWFFINVPTTAENSVQFVQSGPNAGWCSFEAGPPPHGASSPTS